MGDVVDLTNRREPNRGKVRTEDSQVRVSTDCKSPGQDRAAPASGGLTRSDTGQYSRDWSKPLTPSQIGLLREIIEQDTDMTWSQFETQLEHEQNMRIT